MTARAAARLAWLVLVTALALCVPGIALLVAAGASIDDPAWGLPGFEAIFVVAFGGVGAIIASRRPENRIGWIFVASGFLSAVQLIVGGYARYGLAGAGYLPFTEIAAWVSDWIWVPTIVLGLGYLVLLFPDGRLPSAGWRPAGWLLASGAALFVAVIATAPAPLGNFPQVRNPFGVEPLSAFGQAPTAAAALTYSSGMLASGAAIVWRFRRSSGEQRAQLKWFAYAGMLAAVSVIPGLSSVKLGQVILIVASALVPVAAGVAILRYRLYEIDLIISRTIVYGVLTAILAGVYTASITLSQRVFVAVTGEKSDGAIVLTTLIVVSTFTPLKTRLQALVDRRWKAAAAAGPSPADGPAFEAVELIGRLAALRDAGTLTAGEFEAKKADLLGRV